MTQECSLDPARLFRERLHRLRTRQAYINPQTLPITVALARSEAANRANPPDERRAWGELLAELEGMQA